MELSGRDKPTDAGTVPNDWELLRVGDLFSFKNGLNKAKQFFGEGTPIVNYMDVYKNRGLMALDLFGKVTLSEEEKRNFDVRKGDIFFTRTSETVDEIGISSVMLEDVKDTVFSGFVLRGRPKSDRLSVSFSQYCFTTKEVRREIISTASYTTRALTNGRLLSNVRIAVPNSEAEQTAIATALCDADALITALENLIQKKRSIKQGAMHVLLKPKSDWTSITYGDAFDFLATASYSRADLIEDDGIGYVHYGDIHTEWNEFLDLEIRTLPYIDKSLVYNFHFLREGDLIMADASEDYTGVGKSVEVKNLGSMKIISGQHTLLMRDRGYFENGFRGYIHLMSSVKSSLDRLATGLKVFGISKNNLKTVLIPLPPKSVQVRIMNILSNMDSEIKALETKLEKFRLLKQGMMHNLLTGKIRLV